MTDIIDEVKRLLPSITNKRARIVINHILEHGQITTEDLLNYGYKHAPRAARDVREAGIPLTTFNAKDKDGKNIAAYKFADISAIQEGRLAGRSTFPKAFKSSLYILHKGKCTICNTTYEERYLQVDHRVPYEVGGDDPGGVLDTSKFMLLCGSCNRAKSWSCEHCHNWQAYKNAGVCATCYWAYPESYGHIATVMERRLEVTWLADEVISYEWLILVAKEQGLTPQEIIKLLLKDQQKKN
jgi:hypothetical protein